MQNKNTLNESIKKINKRVKILHGLTIALLIINAVVWFTVLFTVHNDYVILLTTGAICVGFVIIIVVVGIYLEKVLTRNLKGLVEGYSGIVLPEDQKEAAILLKRWTKHQMASIKWFLNEFRKEKYPFFLDIVEDLHKIKKGIKVLRRPLYDELTLTDYGKEGNEILNLITQLINRNSYLLSN